MARNAAILYGRDVRCMVDADALLSDVTGLDVVKQDAFHRISTDNVLGDDGTGSLVLVGWGFDCRRLLGLNTSRLAAHQPILAEVLTRDQRVLAADVKITPVLSNGVADVLIEATCHTALGSFALIKRVSELTSTELVAQ